MIRYQPMLTHTPVSTIGKMTDWFQNGPTIAWTRSNPWGDSYSEGSACKAGVQPMSAAVGEFFERKFLETLKPSNSKARLDKLNKDLFQSLRKAFNQTSKANYHHNSDTLMSETSLNSHEFSVVTTFNLKYGTKDALPDVLLSLSGNHPDRKFYPLADSTGCGFHFSPQKAFNAALYEFCERQSLILNWLTGYTKGEYSLKRLSNLNTSSKNLLSRFYHSGKLRIFEISAFEGITCPLILLSAPDEYPVSFCVATASHTNPAKAISDALSELWQSYRFLFGKKEGLSQSQTMDLYQRTFLQSNQQSTVERFTCWSRSHEYIDLNTLDTPSVTTDEIVAAVTKVSDQIYAIFNSEQFGNKICCHCKILSPDFFLNMSIPHTNLHNKFMDSFGRSTCIENSKSPIPFP